MNHFFRNFQVFHCSIENFVHGFLWDITYGRLQVTVVFLQDSINLPKYHLVLIFAQRRYCSITDRQLVIGYYLVYINFVDYTQTFASRAGAFRRIKRKDIWSRFTIRQPGCRVHKTLGVILDAIIVFVKNH